MSQRQISAVPLTCISTDWQLCVFQFGKSGCRVLKQMHTDNLYLSFSTPSLKSQESSKKSARPVWIHPSKIILYPPNNQVA